MAVQGRGYLLASTQTDERERKALLLYSLSNIALPAVAKRCFSNFLVLCFS